MFTRTHIRRSLFALAALTALLGATAAWAGGFFLTVETPASAADPTFKEAVLIMRASGCVDPKDASVTATAEGLVDGRRRSVPLQLLKGAPGVFGVRRQWPAQGVWIVAVTGNARGMTRSALVDVTPQGNARPAQASASVKSRVETLESPPRPLTPAEIKAVLQKLARKAGQSTRASR